MFVAHRHKVAIYCVIRLAFRRSDSSTTVIDPRLEVLGCSIPYLAILHAEARHSVEHIVSIAHFAQVRRLHMLDQYP